MRDETTLINRMVASIQEACGSKQAGTLYHVVFGKSAHPPLTHRADVLRDRTFELSAYPNDQPVRQREEVEYPRVHVPECSA